MTRERMTAAPAHHKGRETMSSLRRLVEALDEAMEVKPPQYEAAVKIIEQIVTKPGVEDIYDLPNLLEELAGCYAKLGRFDQAIAAMKRGIAHGWEGEPDERRGTPAHGHPAATPPAGAEAARSTGAAAGRSSWCPATSSMMKTFRFDKVGTGLKPKTNGAG